MKKRFGLAVVLGSIAVAPGAAQEHVEPEEHEEHFHRNEVAFLLGATYEAEDGENLFTVGGEYPHGFTPRVGVAAAFEHLNDVGAWVFVFPVYYRFYRGLTVAVASRYAIIPGIAYDWVDEEHGTPKAFVYGVKLAIGF